MATSSGAGSHLASVTARMAALQKSRQRLQLSNPQGPQAAVKAPAPTPPSPAAPEQAPAAPPSAAPAAGTEGSRDPQMLQMTQQFLDQVRDKGKTAAPAGPSVATAPPSVPEALNVQVDKVGAAGMSLEMQAMRIFGRTVSAREMVIYTAVRERG